MWTEWSAVPTPNTGSGQKNNNINIYCSKYRVRISVYRVTACCHVTNSWILNAEQLKDCDFVTSFCHADLCSQTHRRSTKTPTLIFRCKEKVWVLFNTGRERFGFLGLRFCWCPWESLIMYSPILKDRLLPKKLYSSASFFSKAWLGKKSNALNSFFSQLYYHIVRVF